MSSSEQRTILYVDNCSAHGTLTSLRSQSSVEIAMLPPNTASQLQPMDADIIPSLKAAFDKKT